MSEIMNHVERINGGKPDPNEYSNVLQADGVELKDIDFSDDY
jgi:hypothetical protein